MASHFLSALCWVSVNKWLVLAAHLLRELDGYTLSNDHPPSQSMSNFQPFTANAEDPFNGSHSAMNVPNADDFGWQSLPFFSPEDAQAKDSAKPQAAKYPGPTPSALLAHPTDSTSREPKK